MKRKNIDRFKKGSLKAKIANALNALDEYEYYAKYGICEGCLYGGLSSVRRVLLSIIGKHNK